jgi:hypothetical protein
MTLSYTQHTLDKLEALIKTLGFKLRYEKGNFKTGSCVLENDRVVIVNKFSNLESKINSLADNEKLSIFNYLISIIKYFLSTNTLFYNTKLKVYKATSIDYCEGVFSNKNRPQKNNNVIGFLGR